MRVKYGKATHLLCRACKRRIFFTEAEMIEAAQKRLVVVRCTHPSCALYGQPFQYDEEEVEIH